MTSFDIIVRITLAIAATKEVVAGYWEKCLAQRAGNSPSAAGSIYPGKSPEEIENALSTADWVPYEHPALAPGSIAYRAELAGQLGIVDLATLAPSTPVVLDDRKGTGTVSATVGGVRGEAVEFTVLILGEEGGREIVFTFHPGAPVRPSSVKTVEGFHGKTISAAEAIAMGLTTAKIV